MAGLFLTDEAGYEGEELWITLALIGWIISFLIGILYYARMGRKQDELVEAGGLESDEFLANYRQIMYVNLAELSMLLLIVIDMTIKPS